jgi:CBS domain-containing protein
MATDPMTVEPEETLRSAADLLTAEGVSGAPVTNNGRVVGVVTLTDIVQFEADDPGAPSFRPDLAEAPEESGIEEPDLPEEQEPYSRWFLDMWEDAGAELTTRFETEAPEWSTLDEHTVSEVMTRAVLSVEPGADLREAASLMEREGVHRLLVIERGELVGILSAWDIVRAVAKGKLGAGSSGMAA